MHTPTIAEPLEVYEDTNPNDIENTAATEVNVEPTPIGTKIVVLLKFIGAGVVAAAMALFLLDGIQVNNDIQRFLTILGFGALLTASGLAVNHWLTDRVASRLFIGLSLAAVPVIASVLGGLIFSLTDAAKTGHCGTRSHQCARYHGNGTC